MKNSPGFTQVVYLKTSQETLQYKGRFSLIVELMLAFLPNTNLVRKVKNLSRNFKRIV